MAKTVDSDQDVRIRPIEEHDLHNGFLDTLDTLSKVGDIDDNKALEILKKIRADPDHMIFVAEHQDRIVGSITLLVEPKFIHKGSLAGHIEDVVVIKEMHGHGIGRLLLNHTLDYAQRIGCYKTILDCGDDLTEFYKKHGFKFKDNAMRYDHT